MICSIMEHLKILDDESNDETLVIEGYLALFGGDDLTGERFTKSTQFESDYTAQDAVLIDFEHGHTPDGPGSPGADDILGRVDWKTAVPDETGLLVKRILNRRNQYVAKVIEPLVRAGLLGSSSEAVPSKVRKSQDGTIEVWPVRRDSFTVTPAEPRLLTTHQMQVIKSLSEFIPAFKSIATGAQESAATVDTAV
jgi:phage head maturation protease